MDPSVVWRFETIGIRDAADKKLLPLPLYVRIYDVLNNFYGRIYKLFSFF